MGLTPEAVGNSEASATNSPSASQLSPVAPSTAPALGLDPARAVPIWWAEMTVAPLPAPRRTALGPKCVSTWRL